MLSPDPRKCCARASRIPGWIPDSPGISRIKIFDRPHTPEGLRARLSVIIPTWNAAGLTLEALAALTANGIPSWAELIVVDDGSQDRTAEQIQTQFPWLQVIRHETNRGFGAAVNTGFKAATGAFLGVVNNDVFVSWNCLERLLQFLDAHPNVGAVSPLIVNGEGRAQQVGFEFPRPPWQRLGDFVRGSRRRSGPDHQKPYRAEYVRGACVVFRHSALQQSGLFDEQFYMFAEEIDLFRRLSLVGWQTWVVPSATATHFAGLSSRNHPDPEVALGFRRQSYRSMCLYYRKHHSWITSVVLRGLLASRVTGRLIGSVLPMVHRSGPRRIQSEHLGCLAAVLKPCLSRPVEPSLPSVSARDWRS